jgi:hypothetical protein
MWKAEVVGLLKELEWLGKHEKPPESQTHELQNMKQECLSLNRDAQWFYPNLQNNEVRDQGNG